MLYRLKKKNLNNFKWEKLPVFFLYLLFTFLFLLSKNYGYFWDNILQTSIEAHRFYWFGFNPFTVTGNENAFGIHSTGYHVPILAYITALLWKYVSYKLWISHFLAWISSIVLIIYTFKLTQFFVPTKYTGWVTILILIEPTILTQFIIASPDFFLITAFITAIYLILSQKTKFLPIVLFLIFTLNMRGTFIGFILLAVHVLYVQDFQNLKKWKWKNFKIIYYYIPTFAFLIFYFSFYFYHNGWFLKNQTGAADHYLIPRSIEFLFVHIAEFVIRSIENGRILIWILAFIFSYQMFKHKTTISKYQKLLITFILLHIALYVVLIFISQVPFSARYFLPHFTLMSLLVVSYLFKNHHFKETFIIASLIFILQITGHFWIYPEPISKSWDNTLAHISFYEIRKEVLDYIEKEGIPFSDVSGGFNIYTNQQFIDLIPISRVINSDFPNSYFLYSNISNLSDEILMKLDNPKEWQLQKTFSKGFVEVKLYKRL